MYKIGKDGYSERTGKDGLNFSDEIISEARTALYMDGFSDESINKRLLNLFFV